MDDRTKTHAGVGSSLPSEERQAREILRDAWSRIENVDQWRQLMAQLTRGATLTDSPLLAQAAMDLATALSAALTLPGAGISGPALDSSVEAVYLAARRLNDTAWLL